MHWFNARSPGPALRLALLTVVVHFAGCRTTPPAPLFVAAGPGWRVQEGQALWRPGRQLPELAGELVVASHADGCCAVQFAKTPLPLVQAQITRTNWLIEFPPRQMCFAGRNPPSTRFVWLQLFAALSGDTLPCPFRFQRKPDGAWRLENAQSGETIEGFLSP